MIPRSIQKKLIDLKHENFGHIGVFKTWAILDQHFWWRGCRRMMKNQVKCCDLCQRVKDLNFSIAGSMKNVTAEKPNELVAVDCYGPLLRTIGGVEYIFAVFNIFSRLVTLYPIKNATTAATINRMRQYFQDVGVPLRVLSVYGSQYTSDRWINFLKDNKIEPIFCSIRHPESNPSERVMRELRFFRSFCSDKHTAWARYVKDINTLLNFTLHTTTGYTPYELHFSESPKNKIRSFIQFPEEQKKSHEIKILMANFRTKKACKRREKSQKRVNKIKLQVGDKVLVRIPYKSSALDKVISKFCHIYYGPYRISRVFNENAFEVGEIDESNRMLDHYNRADLRVYYTKEPDNCEQLGSITLQPVEELHSTEGNYIYIIVLLLIRIHLYTCLLLTLLLVYKYSYLCI